MKKSFSYKYKVEIDETYKLERPALRDPIEWYYVIPAKYGHFYPYSSNTIALYCTANRIKEAILRQFKGKVTLFVECEDESVLLVHKELFLDIAPIAKAKRKRGRKALSEIEKNRLVEAGKEHQFTGKSLQYAALEERFSPRHDESVTV